MLFRHHTFKPTHTAKLLRSGTDYFSRLETLIDTATHSIHLQVYIFDLDATGNNILNKLIAAAQRGVAVYLVVDGYASPAMTQSVLNSLRSKGIFAKQFAPLHYKSFKIGRRLHHKIILVDETIALIGGINIADKYSGYPQKTPWLDVAIEIQGKVCLDVKAICESLWPKRVRRKWNKLQPIISEEAAPFSVSLAQNDWWRRKIEISKTYRDMIRESRTELTIMASYFLPGFRKRLLLINAADRGVNVTMILGGNSDIPLIKPAMHYLYAVLCKHNITVYEWTPSVLHGKMAICDHHFTTIGSYNLNALSDYGSLELNVNVDSEMFAHESGAFLKSIIKDGCVRVDAKQYAHKPYSLIHAYRLVCFQLLRLSLFILFVLMRRDRISKKHI